MRNRAEKKTLEASTEGGRESKSAGINGAIKWIAVRVCDCDSGTRTAAAPAVDPLPSFCGCTLGWLFCSLKQIVTGIASLEVRTETLQMPRVQKLLEKRLGIAMQFVELTSGGASFFSFCFFPLCLRCLCLAFDHYL